MRLKDIKRDFTRNWTAYLLAVPVLAFFIIFSYIPMAGIVLSFEKFTPKAGVFLSEWIGLKNFINFFGSYYFWRLLRNTFLLSFFDLLFNFPAPIIFALLLNEVENKIFKKIVQTISYMPYFISTVVLVSMILQFTDVSTGIVNQIIVAMGGEATNFMGNASYFRGLYVWTGVWQTMGYSAIVYLAALTGVPMDLYEAAKVDGASKLRRILSIDLPYIAPTIITLFILNTGSILSIGFEKVYLMQNSINTPVSEVISTYVYKIGVLQFSYSYSTAVGLFNSVVNLAMLLIVNTVSDRIGKVSVL